MQGKEEEALLVTLWLWVSCEAHLQRPFPSFLAPKAQIKQVLHALHLGVPSAHSDQDAEGPPRVTFADRPASPSSSPSTPAQQPESFFSSRMAAEEGPSPGVRKSRSWSQGREVSWDEMGSLGLHKALNEYYKLTSPKPSSVGRQQRCKGASGGLLATLLCATVLHPVPSLLTPESLSAAAKWGAYALAVILYQTAVLTLPLALWLAFSSISGATALQLPPAVARALPGLGGQQALPLPPRPLVLAALLGFMALLQAAERVVLGVAASKAARTARALRPEQLEAWYAGWELPDGWANQQGSAGSDPPSPVDASSETMQRLAREAAYACEGVYGAGSCPGDLDSYEDVVALVLRLCNDAGVQVQGPSRPSPQALLAMLQQAKQTIGLQ